MFSYLHIEHPFIAVHLDCQYIRQGNMSVGRKLVNYKALIPFVTYTFISRNIQLYPLMNVCNEVSRKPRIHESCLVTGNEMQRELPWGYKWSINERTQPEKNK